MLEQGFQLLSALPDDARVVDIGGWAAPLNRADWVIDVMPYETRGGIEPGVGPGPTRFRKNTWVERDLCGREPYPFDDDFFDFALCTFTLEDLRDPVWVCSEMSRIAKAGYVEVPSILDELTWEVPEPSGGPWVGHDHHIWLCSEDAQGLVFLKKFPSLNGNPRVRVSPAEARELSWEERVLAVAWKGTLHARERFAVDSYPVEELEQVVAARFPRPRSERRLRRLRRA